MTLALLLAFYTLSTRNLASADYRAFVKGLTGSVIMALSVYLLQTQLHGALLLPLYILVGAAIYGLCVRALRMLSYDDVILLARVFPKPIERFVLFIGKLVTSS